MFPVPVAPGFPGWYHLVFFGLFIPWRVYARRSRMVPSGGPMPDRAKRMLSTALGSAILFAVSLVIARLEGVRLFPRVFPSILELVIGLLVWAGLVGFMWPRWRRAVQERKRIVYLFMAQTPREKVSWTLVSLLAGIGEEVTWRGVQFALLTGLIGEPWIAALISAISFGISHAGQGWKSVLVIVGFALLFQGLVWLSGSLYVAMAVHTAYDLAAGFAYGRLGKQLGYEPGPESVSPPAKA